MKYFKDYMTGRTLSESEMMAEIKMNSSLHLASAIKTRFEEITDPNEITLEQKTATENQEEKHIHKPVLKYITVFIPETGGIKCEAQDIKEYKYDPENRELFILLKDGLQYHYVGISYFIAHENVDDIITYHDR